jgi:clostripain
MSKETTTMIDKVSPGQNYQMPVTPQPAGQSEERAPEAAPSDTAELGQNKEGEKEWTVLFYFDGKNNLAPMAKTSFKSVQKVGSDENVSLVAQLAIGKNDVQRGEMNNVEGSKELFPGGENIGQVNMGDPDSLKQFVEWGMKKYPAKHYALVLWDHGAGFKGSMTDDETKKLINNIQLAQALHDVETDTGHKMDLLNFNACLMGQAEVAYELRDGARYMVGSEEVEAGMRIPIPKLFGTTPQHKVMTDLKEGIKERGHVEADELAKLYVFESKNQFGQTMFTPTQSAFDLSKMADVKNGADTVAKLLLDEIKKDPQAADIIRKDIKHTQRFLNFDMYAKPYVDYRDLGDFAKTMMAEKRFADTGIPDAAKTLLEAVNNAIIAEEHASESFGGRVMEGATGMSTYLPTNYGFDPHGHSSLDGVPAGGTHGYENMSYAKDTHWDELLQAVSVDNDWKADLAVKHPKINKALETALPIAQYEGYQQAWATVVNGATKPVGGMIPLMSFPYFVPLPGVVAGGVGILGGALKTEKAAEKIYAGATKDYAPGKNAKTIINGVLDAVVGVGSMVTCGALLAGVGSVAFPAGVVVLALGLGRSLISLGAGILKSHKAGAMSIEEKIQSMQKPAPETTAPPAPSAGEAHES